ncbi:radical SAM protein [Candidatus Bipolaricaulota bacterium]|nr:radical SAM protein [Candidatus Bipolaricaulota bacterium]
MAVKVSAVQQSVIRQAASVAANPRAIKTLFRALSALPVRGSVVRLADRAMWESLRRSDNLPGVARDEWLTLRSLLYSFHQGLSNRTISPQAWQRFVEFAAHALGAHPAREAFRGAYGQSPPGFLTISPTRSCNLSCTGCYAGTENDARTLSFAVLDRVVQEMEDLWGARFAVISGGEPFLYQSEGNDLLNLAERHPKLYFLVYTNGTVIDRPLAKRLAEAGNVTPAISVEGTAPTTERRRGDGTFTKVLEAFRHLRAEGVPFGISMTATRENCEELLSDDVVGFYFEGQGALYGWIFQYMPIGRGYDLSLMVTPEQRLRLQRRMWEVIRTKRIFLMDFWNSGTACHGCVAAGRAGGYFYINWNGDVTPCVFIPYAGANIHEIYAAGGTINDLMRVPFFADIRQWQLSYGYRTKPQATQNLIRPCPHRDHFDFLLPLLDRHRPKPINQEAQDALKNPTYVWGLLAYGAACAEVLDPIWLREYRQLDEKGEATVGREAVAQGALG